MISTKNKLSTVKSSPSKSYVLFSNAIRNGSIDMLYIFFNQLPVNH